MAFLDHFPCDPSHADFAVHEQLDEVLRNCDELSQTAAPLGMLFPAYFATDAVQRKAWIPCTLERLEWHLHRDAADSEASRWALHLRRLLGLLLEDVAVLCEPDFERLVRIAPALCQSVAGHRLDSVVGMVAKTLGDRRNERLPTQLAERLTTLSTHLVGIHDHSPDTFAILFRLFREGWIEIRWIQGISDFPQGGRWARLLNLADHRWQSEAMTAKQSGELQAEIHKIGRQEIAGLVVRAIDSLQSPEPLDGAGMTMLRQMLLWLQADPSLEPVDDALYRLCSIRWVAGSSRGDAAILREWIPTLVRTLAMRPRDRAFACCEMLSQNPDTKQIPAVVALYNQLLAEVVGSASLTPSLGVDGFAISSSEDVPMQNLLDGVLRGAATLSGKSHLDLALRQANGEHERLLRAMHRRVEWLVKSEPPVPKGQPPQMPRLSWRCDLGSLYCRLLDHKATTFASVQDLTAMCQVDAEGWLGISPASSILTQVERWIDAHGFSEQLTAALELWKKSLFGTTSALALRKRVEWLLWFDTSAPVNEKSCWSAIIREDLRSMPAELRGPWIALLRNISTTTAHEPTKKWLKPASDLLMRVGQEDFQARVRRWFAPFQQAQDLKITIAGRDVLLALMWYSLAASDARVDEAVTWFGKARWKAKTDLDRTARLLPVWVYVLSARTPELAIEAIHDYKSTNQLELTGKSLEIYHALCIKYGRQPAIAAAPQPPALDLEAIGRKAMEKVLASHLPGLNGSVEGDSMTVTNPSGERYRIGLRDGRIVRASDGRLIRLEIDWSQPPFGPFQRMIDGMDLARPFQPNYTRALLCAQILAGSLPVQVPMVVEDESA